MRDSTMCSRISIVAVLLAVSSGCDCGAATKPSAPVPVTASGPYGLTPEQARMPVLKLANGRSVSLLDFAQLLGPAPLQRSRPPEVERRRAYLDSLVENELLAAEAEARGHAAKPADAVRQAALVQTMVDRLFGAQGELIAPVTEKDVRAAYDAQPDRFTAPERRRVSQILIGGEDAAKLLLQQLKSAPNLPKAFGEAALRQTYDMKTRGVRGDLGYFTAHQPPPQPGADAVAQPSMRLQSELSQAIRDAAFAIGKEGELYDGLVQTERGFHLLLLTGKQGGHKIPYEQVQRSLSAEVLERRRQDALEDFAAKLQADAKPVFDDANLATVKLE